MGNNSHGEIIDWQRVLNPARAQFLSGFGSEARMDSLCLALANFEPAILSADAAFDLFVAIDRNAICWKMAMRSHGHILNALQSLFTDCDGLGAPNHPNFDKLSSCQAFDIRSYRPHSLRSPPLSQTHSMNVARRSSSRRRVLQQRRTPRCAFSGVVGRPIL